MEFEFCSDSEFCVFCVLITSDAGGGSLDSQRQSGRNASQEILFRLTNLLSSVLN